MGYGGVGGYHLQARARAEVRREQLPVDAQLPKPGFDEQRDHRAEVPRRPPNLRAVSERVDEADQFLRHLRLAQMRLAVRRLRLHARQRLGGDVILLDREADRVSQIAARVLALAFIDEAAVEVGESDLAVAQLARFGADGLGDVLARRIGGRLHVAGGLEPLDYGLYLILMLAVQLRRLRRRLFADVERPERGRAVFHRHAFKRILARVVGDFEIPRGRSRHGFQIRRHWNLRRRVVRLPARSGHRKAQSSSRHAARPLGLR